MSTSTTDEQTIEAIARCLAKEAIDRRDKKLGFHEVDDLSDALEWLGYRDEAKRLAAIIGGKLVA